MVAVLAVMVAGCGATGGDAGSETTSGFEMMSSTPSTAGAETQEADAFCQTISTAEVDRIVADVYEEEGVPLPDDDGFSLMNDMGFGVADCDWMGSRRAVSLRFFGENAPQNDEADWCPGRTAEDFDSYEVMPEGVEVADIGVHRFWASDWRLHVDLKADNGAWWCFNYVTHSDANQMEERKAEVQALGLGIASQMASHLPGTAEGWVFGTSPSYTEQGDSLSEEGLIYTGNWTDVSDSRLMGTENAVLFCEAIPEEDEVFECTARVEIVNESGTWVGTATGSSDRGLRDFRGTLVGTGDYAGLRLNRRLQGTDLPWTMSGTIEPLDAATMR
jgi:hypothetical protein